MENRNSGNDVSLSQLMMRARAAVARAPRLAPEKQWWNVAAKVARAEQIAEEELYRAQVDASRRGLADAHNNSADAMRHARWSKRMSDEIDPVSARLFGIAHEAEGSLPSAQTLAGLGAPARLQRLAQVRGWHDQSDAEALMDMRNNAEGRRAAYERRPVNPANLQTVLDSPSPSNPAYPRARPRGGGPGFR